MKTKKSKKLRFKKETIVHLNSGAMRNLKGGADTDFCPTVTCQTCDDLCNDTANCHLEGDTTLPTFCPLTTGGE